MSAFLKKHLNTILVAVLLVTLAVSSLVNQQRTSRESNTVSLPVTTVTAKPSGAIEQFRAQRDETALRDLSALQALCEQTDLDEQTRSDAASMLQALVAHREKQMALEGALLESGISPCVAVVTEGAVTIVTEKETLSDGESALLLTLAQTHADVAPSGVRVVTAEKEADVSPNP